MEREESGTKIPAFRGGEEMRDDEISEHCLCDKCAGHECGADNPEERAAEEKRAREARDNQMRDEGAKAEREQFAAFLDFVIRKGELQYHSTFGCYNIHDQFKDIVDKAKSLRGVK